MNTQKITIIIRTDMDPSQLLEMAQEQGSLLIDWLREYEDATYDENEVCVEDVIGVMTREEDNSGEFMLCNVCQSTTAVGGE